MNIPEIRQKYPQYSDLSDHQLATRIHATYYRDMDFDTFSKKIGFNESQVERAFQRFWHTLKATPANFAATARSVKEMEDPESFGKRLPLRTHMSPDKPRPIDPDDRRPYAERYQEWREAKLAEGRTEASDLYDRTLGQARKRIDKRARQLIKEHGYTDSHAKSEATVEDLYENKRLALESLKKIEEKFKLPAEFQDHSSGFIEDVAGGLATSAVAIPAFLINPVLGYGTTYTQLHGSKVHELESVGVEDPETVLRSAVISAGLQTPLEAAGNLFMISRILKAKGTWTSALVNIAESMGGEGLTEFVQQYPDEFATMLALNPDLSAEDLEVEYIKRLPDTTKEGAYAGLVGSVAGGLTTTAGITSSQILDKLVSDKQKDINRRRDEDPAHQDKRARAEKVIKASVVQNIADLREQELKTRIEGTPEEIQQFIENPEESTIDESVLDEIIAQGEDIDLDVALDRIFSDPDTRTEDFDGDELAAPAQIGTGDVSPIFFSALERGVENFKQEKAPAQQWQGMINKLPLKKEEREWIGLDDWLDEQKGKVTKQEILDFVRANNVEVREVEKGGSQDWAVWDGEEEQYFESEKDAVDYANEMGIEVDEDSVFMKNLSSDSEQTKFSDYQLPGGKNYKELLLTLPADALGGYTMEKDDVPFDSFKRYQSSHFDEPNILAHIRFNERTDADGNRVLFIEEIQSDWHQEGRKKGYSKTGLPEGWAIKKDGKIWVVYDENGDPTRFASKTEEGALAQVVGNDEGGVPDAPFKKSWPLLAMKRMVRYAAENGFDKVAWTTGEQQADRYDLSKQVDLISYQKNEDGTYKLNAQVPGRGGVMMGESLTIEQVEDNVGKELAEKIAKDKGAEENWSANNEPDDFWYTFRDTDLKVGGENMKAFYDKMLPSAVNKFFKKYGVRVSGTTLKQQKKGERQRISLGSPVVVHSIDITPSLKQTAMYEGLPMFAVGQIGNQKANQPLPEFDQDAIEHHGLREATQYGLLSNDEAAVIDGIMQMFPEAWQEHFEPRFSDQRFAPTGAQLKAHGIPASQAADKVIEGVLLTEKAGELKTDARHLAVMFSHADNISTFLHEFGEFAHKRLLSTQGRGSDASIVKAAWKKSGSKQDRNEWFSDQFRDWWLRQLNGQSNIVSKDLQGVFRKVLAAIKEIWRRLKSLGKKGPLDDLFEDIITNGRDLNEKYYYSAKDVALNYVIGAEASRELTKKQGFSGNNKTMISWDPGSICPKQRNLVDYALEQAFGKSVKDIRDEDATSEVWQVLSDIDFWIRVYDEAVKDGIDAPCSYCYVEQARKKAMSYWKKGKPVKGVNFVMAKMVYETTNYRDAILKWNQKKIDDLNDRGGLRLFPFSDYVRSLHRSSVDLLLKHAKARGLSVKAITKNPEFVEDFADRGITINISIDDGVLGQNGGVAWDKAAELKKKHDNVKIRVVAANQKQYREYAYLSYKGLSPFIDVITPYHRDDTTKPMPEGYEDMGTRTRGGKQLIAWIEEQDSELKKRTCCLAGGKCFGGSGHQKGCGANCGALAGNLSIPASIGPRDQAQQEIDDDTDLAGSMNKAIFTDKGNTRKVAVREALRVAINEARKAYREGNKQGVEEGKAKIRAIVAKSQAAQKLRNEASKLRKQIARELKQTKVKKKGGKPQGRFGAERQEVLNTLQGIMKLRQEDAAVRLEGNLIAYQDKIPPEEIALQNKLLAMKSTSLFEIDVDTLDAWGQLLKQIKAYKEEGILDRDLKAANRGNLMAFYREEVIRMMGGIPAGIETVGEEAVADKSIKARIRNAIFAGSANNMVTGWKDLLDILSFKDEGSAPGQSLISQFGDVLDVKNAEKEGNLQAMEELRQIIFDVFNIKSDRQMVKMFQQDSVEVSLGEFQNVKGEIVELVMSRAQARKRAMELLDPTLHDTIFKAEGMAWTQDMVDSLREFLTPQDEEFIARQMDWYREYYERTNQIYSEIYGVNLPKNDNYSPISREGVNKDDEAGLGEFLKEMPFRASATTAGGLKSRSANLYPLKLRNDMEVLMSHVAEMEHFKAWAFKIRDLNAVFSNPNVRQAMRINFGSNIDKTIQNFIQAFASGGAEMATTFNGLDKIRTRYTKAVLAVKPTLFLKQLTSSVAYADTIPVTAFSKEFIKTILNLPKATRFLMDNSTLMKDRWAKGEIERDIKTAMNSEAFARFRTSPSFSNALMFLIKLGDAGAIVAGGYPVYKYYRSHGMTREQAIRQFESVTESTQQSADLSEQSTWQRGGSFAKLFTMFMTSPNQYLRKEIGAIRNIAAGRIAKRQFLKTVAIYHFILPMFFQWVSDRFTWDEDEQLRAMILGPLNGFFILGDGLDFVIRGALDQQRFGLEIPILGIFKDLEKAIKLVDIDEMDTEDFLRAIRGLAGAVGAIIGKPLKQVVDVTKGFSDTLAGEYEKGIAEMMGWSPHIAEKAAEGDD